MLLFILHAQSFARATILSIVFLVVTHLVKINIFDTLSVIVKLDIVSRSGCSITLSFFGGQGLIQSQNIIFNIRYV